MPILPEYPSLEHLKKQAKSLLRAASAQDAAALQRFAALPALARKPVAEWPRLALHDAQSVIAREYGMRSWKELRAEVEARTLSFDEAVEEFVRCATGGAPDRAERLLALHPKISSASLHTALVLGDAAGVRARLQADPELARRPGGPQVWEPLLYVCHTSVHQKDAARAEGLVAIARRLCELGADPNSEYHWDWHPELPRTVLWAALCAVEHLPLAEVLLEAGANPTDGVSVHIASGTGNLAALEVLYRYGVDVDGIPGGVPPLVYVMSWATDPTGLQWLLEHGADPNLSWGSENEAPLHVAARRWDVAMVDLLVEHGADPERRRADGRTPYALAKVSGNNDVAARLLAMGVSGELSDTDRFVAACARGDRAAAEKLPDARPAVRQDLRPEDHLLLHVPAESGDTLVLEVMLSCGFNPNARDRDGVTPLHRAAMAGRPAAVSLLLASGADVNALDGMFAATPLVWAVEGRDHGGPDADHVGVARTLIEAGSSTEWQPPANAPNQERTLDGLSDLCRAAEHAGPEGTTKRP